MTLLRIVFIPLILAGCSSGPSVSECYGKAPAECQKYWAKGNPGFVLVEPKLDEAYAKRFNVPSLELLINYDATAIPRRWHKDDATENDYDVALLECGATEFGDNVKKLMTQITKDDYNGKLLQIKRCMLADGFTYLGDFDPCKENPIPACDLPVITRSAERRLNSEYCIKNAYVDACQPQSRERILNTKKCQEKPQLYFCNPE